MCADDSAIHKVDGAIQQAGSVGIGLERRQDAIADVGMAPAIESAGDRFPRSIAVGQIPPGRSGAQNAENPGDDRAMIMIGPARPWFSGWEQQFKPLPLLGG